MGSPKRRMSRWSKRRGESVRSASAARSRGSVSTSIMTTRLTESAEPSATAVTTGSSDEAVKTLSSTKPRRDTSGVLLTGGWSRCLGCHRWFRPENDTYHYCSGACAWKSLKEKL